MLTRENATSFLFCLLFFTTVGFAQDVEPMIVVGHDSASFRIKAENYLAKSKTFRENTDYQNAKVFSRRAINGIYKYNELIVDSTQFPILLLQAKIFREFAIDCYYLGDYMNAMIFYKKCLNYLNYIPTKDYKQNQLLINQIEAQAFNGQAIIFSTQGNISEGLDNFLNALEMYEINKDSAGIAKLNNNIGIIYKNQEKYEVAENYYKKALKIYTLQDKKPKMLVLYNNLGSLYIEMNKIDSSLQYLGKAQKLNEIVQQPREFSQTLNNIGKAYAKRNEYKKAIVYLKKAVNIKLKEKANVLLMNSYIDLVDVYMNIGDLRNAKYYLSKLKNLNSQLNLLPASVKMYKYYYEIYEKQNNVKLALKFHLLYKKAYDSLNEIDQRTEAAKIQLSYDLKKKIQELELLSKEKQFNEEKLHQKELIERRQTTTIIISISLLLITLIFVWFILIRLKINRRQRLTIQNQKMEMDDKNRILKNAYEEINQQKAEILKQRNALSGQKEKAFSLFNDLRASIVYAQHIQNALLPDINQMDVLFKDYFVLNKPHSIVSGDFYWGQVVNDWKVFAVADCTGHGVPGALMSMLGITFLNEIVKYKDVRNTALVLGYLRKYIISALRSTDSTTNRRDGMDISVIAKEPNSNNLHFAGANSSIYIIRSSSEPLLINNELEVPTMTHESRKLYEIKGDRMPIGFDEEMSHFSNNVIEIQEEDQIYLFYDGYADQFGGEDGKKMKYRRFKELILNSGRASMHEQKVILNDYLENWMGEYRQVDDILVVGGKIRF